MKVEYSSYSIRTIDFIEKNVIILGKDKLKKNLV